MTEKREWLFKPIQNTNGRHKKKISPALRWVQLQVGYNYYNGRNLSSDALSLLKLILPTKHPFNSSTWQQNARLKLVSLNFKWWLANYSTYNWLFSVKSNANFECWISERKENYPSTGLVTKGFMQSTIYWDYDWWNHGGSCFLTFTPDVRSSWIWPKKYH